MLLLEPEGLADTALDRIALHRLARMPKRDKKTQASGTRFAPPYVEGVARNAAPHSLAQQPLEISPPRDPQLHSQTVSRPTLPFEHAARASLHC